MGVKCVKNGKFIPCKKCQQEIYVRPCEINKSFCSLKCSRALQKRPKPSEIFIECKFCKKIIKTFKSSLKINKYGFKLCSRKCLIEFAKKGLATWTFRKTGDNTSGNKYIRKQINNIRMKMHRRIMQEHLGRKLEIFEHIHHINGNPKDNRIENLHLLTASEHSKLHKRKSSSVI